MKLNKEDLPPTDGVWECNGMRWCSWLNGQLHNSLGPAVIICDDGSKEWWVNGQGIVEQDYLFAVISFLLGIDRETTKIIEQEMKK